MSVAVRACSTPLEGNGKGAPASARAPIDARPEFVALRIFAIGRRELAEHLPAVYAAFGRRFVLA